jgi:hypothetical protein
LFPSTIQIRGRPFGPQIARQSPLSGP